MKKTNNLCLQLFVIIFLFFIFLLDIGVVESSCGKIESGKTPSFGNYGLIILHILHVVYLYHSHYYYCIIKEWIIVREV